MAVLLMAVAVSFSVFVSSPVSAADVAVAKGIYQARCAFCHGEKGGGDGIAGGSLQPPPTDFTSAAYWKGTTMAQVRSGIIDGKPGTAMVGFGSTLAPGEVDALVQFLEGFKPKD